MENLKEIKGRISSVSSTQQITKAMKFVSAAKLRKTQLLLFSVRDFFGRLSAVTCRVCHGEHHPYLVLPQEEGAVLYLLVSADRGLCGAFSNNVFKSFLMQTQDVSSACVMPLGKRALEFAQRQCLPESIMDAYWDIFSSFSYERVSALVDHIVDAYKAKKFTQVQIVYNAFKNVAVQLVRSETFFPISLPSATQETSSRDYVYESGVAETVEMLLPYYLKNQLFLILLESQAAEHAARMTSMSKATENTEELIRALKISYNRTRQTAITTELLEIIAGADALKK